MKLDVGTVVWDRKWGGRCSGTIVGREGRSVFVAWHNSFVEDELDIDEVEIWPEAPATLAAWRGGLGRLGADGSFEIERSHKLNRSCDNRIQQPAALTAVELDGRLGECETSTASAKDRKPRRTSPQTAWT